MSKGNKSINIGINILLKIVGKLPKEVAKRVHLPLRGSLGWGGVGTESPLRYLIFCRFRNIFKKNKIILGRAGAGRGRRGGVGRAGAGRREAEHRPQLGQPPGVRFLGGLALVTV